MDATTNTIKLTKLATSTIEVNTPVSEPAQVAKLLGYLQNEKQEHFLTLCLDTSCRVQSIYTVTIGLLNRTQAHAREVFYHAIAERCHSIIIAHNHPTGEIVPSPQDEQVTRSLIEAGKLIGINILDHLIIGHNDNYFSFNSERPWYFK